jgi:hypothetical protein
MADVVVSGTPVNSGAPAPKTNAYTVKAGKSLSFSGGETVRGGETANLTDAAAHAFRDKLEPSEQLADVVYAIEHDGARREQLHVSPVPQVRPDGRSTPTGGAQASDPNTPDAQSTTPNEGVQNQAPPKAEGKK